MRTLKASRRFDVNWEKYVLRLRYGDTSIIFLEDDSPRIIAESLRILAESIEIYEEKHDCL